MPLTYRHADAMAPWRPQPSTSSGAPRPIGRATVERMLGDTFTKVKHESDKAVWVGAAALTAILVVGFGLAYIYQHQTAVDASRQAEQNSANPAADGAGRQERRPSWPRPCGRKWCG